MIFFGKSKYSLRYGTIDPEKLPVMAKGLGYDCVALTDIQATTGVYDFLLSAKEQGIKGIAGIEFRSGPTHVYTGIACNEEGFRELNELVTRLNMRQELPDKVAPAFQHSLVIYPFRNIPEKLRENEYCGVRLHELTRLYGKDKKFLDKCVLFHPVTFETSPEFELHKVLRAIDNNALFSKLDQVSLAAPDEFPHSLQEVLKQCELYPQLITNLKTLIDQCNYEFDFKTPKNKKYYTGSKYSDMLLLEQLAIDGLKWRYGENHKEANQRVKKELAVIDQLNFSAYFLIAWDIVRYSKSRGFYHVGRGSGANSVVSYCLGITDVCPIGLNLYFERFLNPHRLSPPDFDIDWSWKTRDEILTYIFKRFGAEHTAFMGAIGTFKYRSHIRELGKVFGLPKAEIDVMTDANRPRIPKSAITDKILHYSSLLEGFPNLRTLHACGILITERPLTYYTALDMPPKGFRTAQFDMYIGEEIGFEKLDILSQRGIGHINDCEKIILETRGEKVDVHNIPAFTGDTAINEKLKKGDTLGCFYIESPAMRGLLKRLRCDSYTTLVAASSIIRPGVAQSGMMREYINRHSGKAFEYPHPVFKEQLEETYGIMVYQEDVIKIAHHFAGLTLAEADIFRRAMSGKSRSKQEFENVKQKFFSNCREKGYTDELAREVYRQIQSFAGYSFCKAHSASYSVESYQSLYLKTYYPIEFSVAVINNFGGFYRTEVYVHEAKRVGAKINLPCVNHSRVETCIANGEIYLGFQHLHGFPADIAQQVVEERSANGAYSSLDNFLSRIEIGKEALKVLVFVGALRAWEQPKNELALQGQLQLGHIVPKSEPEIFQFEKKVFQLPAIERLPFEDAFDELELLGFTVSCSPFDLLKTSFRGEVKARELVDYEGRMVKLAGYLIATKDVPTAKGRMFFGTWIDQHGDYFDTTHFPQSATAYPFTGGGCYLLLGKVTVDFDFPSIEITKMSRLPIVADPRYGNEPVKKTTSFPGTFDVDPVFLTRKAYPSVRQTAERFNTTI